MSKMADRDIDFKESAGKMPEMTTCEEDGSIKAFKCQREEQCDDCWM